MTEESGKHFKEQSSATFEETATVLRQAIEENRQYFQNLKIIAEPGRFFASESMTLCARVFGRRILFDCNSYSQPMTEAELLKTNNVTEVKYYVGEGMYGCFNSIVFDHVIPSLKYFRGDKEIQATSYVSHIFGPTCDSMDCIMKEKEVPLLEIGDWITIDAFGAYTWCASTEFNGIPLVNVLTVYEEE